MGSTVFQYDHTAASGENAGSRDLSPLLKSVLTIGSGLDLNGLLQRIVEGAVELVDARFGALGVLDGRDRLAEWITVGIAERSRATIGDLPNGLGVIGSIITGATPLRVEQLSKHRDSSGFPPNHPSMTSFLGFPIRVDGEVFANLYLTGKTTGQVFTDVDEELALEFAAAAGVAIENARLYEQARRREAVMAAAQEVATAVLAGIGERPSLELIARHAKELLSADVATVEPAALDNRSRSGRIDRTLFVALIVDSRPFGTLTVTRADRAAPFTAADLEGAQSFAIQASAVLQQERVRKQRQRIMLLDDHERIGRDLHDTVIQRLFATGLALQRASRLVTDSDAQESIRSAVDELDRTICHIRTVIFDVETSRRDRVTGVRGQIVELARNAGLGFQPRIVFTGSVDTTVAGRLRTDLLATVQEVLSNVVRHADASRVDLELGVDDAIALRVVDDGIGFLVGSHDGPGHGMANMRARAARLGGTLDVSSRAGGGTEIRWRVPLPARPS